MHEFAQHAHKADISLVGHVTVCIGRDAGGGHTWNFYADTTDPVGLTVAFAELVFSVLPQSPDSLLHLAGACGNREHVGEVLKQMPEEYLDTLRAYIKNQQLEDGVE
jgi:hypothetical protein